MEQQTEDNNNASVEEIESQLSIYKEQFSAVESALRQEPGNDALLKVKGDLFEVINLTEDLLKLRKKALPITVSVIEDFEEPPPPPPSNYSSNNNSVVSAPIPESPLRPGIKCMAKYSVDGLWYEATIDSVPTKENGKYVVIYSGYGNKEEASPEDVAPLDKVSDDVEEEEEESESTGRNSKLIPIPKNLKILPGDSEEVRNAKRKRVHAIKSLNRLKKLEEDRNSSKSAWRDFTNKSAKKAKTGFISGKGKESIFKSPDSVTGKVGVTGSGKQITQGIVFKPKEVERTRKVLSTPIPGNED